MNKFIFCFLILPVNILTFGQTYVPVDTNSTVKFTVKNFGFNVEGLFSGLQGNIYFDSSKLAACNFDVTIDAKSVNTGNGMRDEHLKEDSYFDVKNFPLIHFVSTKVTLSNSKGIYFVFARLTIKNQTKDISFPFSAKEAGDGFLFSGEFKIDRKDFTVGRSGTISDNVNVLLRVFAKALKK